MSELWWVWCELVVMGQCLSVLYAMLQSHFQQINGNFLFFSKIKTISEKKEDFRLLTARL